MSVTVVTKGNFPSLLPSILHHIKEADFVTFDTELTGLTSGSACRYLYYDDIPERYRKLRDSGSNFGMLQFGLSAFKYKASGDRFTSTSWSFHLFPHVPSTGGGDYRRWMVQLSSILFLREHGFDFNRTFLEGISFLSQKEEADMRTRQQQQQQGATARGERDIVMKDDDKVFVEEMVQLIRNWQTGADGQGDGGANGAFKLPPCNSYQRRLLYENLPKEFGSDLVLKRSSINGDACLLVEFKDEGARAAAAEEDAAAFEKTLLEQVGFRRVWDFVMAQRKPIVGHNCWLDLCHMYSKFIGPLPADWESFRATVSQKMGPLCDTKFLVSQLVQRDLLKLDGTSLSDLAIAVDDPGVWGGVKVRVDGGKTKNKAREVGFHDAGFDAHCTGKVFVGVATLLAKHAAAGRAPSVPEMIREIFATPSQLGLVGRLFMMQSDYDVHGVWLGLGEGGIGEASTAGTESGSSTGRDLQTHPHRGNLWVLTELAPETLTSHVEGALLAVGAVKEKLQFVWKDDRTVYVRAEDFALPDEQDDTTLDVKTGQQSTRVRLQTYARWRQVAIESPPPLKRLRL